VRTLALIALAATVASAAPRRAPLPPVPSLRAMSRAARSGSEPLVPRCFAYSPAQHAFACVGQDRMANTDHIVAEDQATNVRIDLIGPQRQRSWVLAAIGNRATTPRRTIESELGAAQLVPLRGRGTVVTANAWTKLGDLALMLEVDAHDGDASFENFGGLTLACQYGDQIEIDLRATGIELGETARAWLSPDGGWLALSIVGIDGGEDTTEYTLDTAVIDLTAACNVHSKQVWTSSSSHADE